MTNTYTCPICYAVNHAHRLHCQSCGTIPKHYSVTLEPARYQERDGLTYLIPVHAAEGVERQERRCYARVNLRTVPADYYASGE